MFASISLFLFFSFTINRAYALGNSLLCSFQNYVCVFFFFCVWCVQIHYTSHLFKHSGICVWVYAFDGSSCYRFPASNAYQAICNSIIKFMTSYSFAKHNIVHPVQNILISDLPIVCPRYSQHHGWAHSLNGYTMAGRNTKCQQWKHGRERVTDQTFHSFGRRMNPKSVEKNTQFKKYHIQYWIWNIGHCLSYLSFNETKNCK